MDDDVVNDIFTGHMFLMNMFNLNKGFPGVWDL